MYSSPGTPIGTGASRASSTYSCVLAIGRPIGTVAAPRRWPARPRCHVDRRFRRAIQVVDPRRRPLRLARADEIARQRFAAADHVPHARTRARSRLQQRREHRRHEMQPRHAGLRDPRAQIRGIPVPARPRQHQRRARSAAARRTPTPTRRTCTASSAVPDRWRRGVTRPASTTAGSGGRRGY